MMIGMMLSVHLFFDITLNRRIRVPWLNWKIPFILACLFIMIGIGFFLQSLELGFSNKGFNHFWSYYVIIFIFFITVSVYLYHFSIPLDKIFKYITYGVILISSLTLLEFILKNFTSIPFDSFIHRTDVKEYNAIFTASSRVFVRARGMAEESGPTAMYLLMFYPFLVYYFTKIIPSRKKLILYSFLVFSALVTTFSAAGIFELSVAAVSVYIIYFFKHKKARLKLTTVIFWCFAIAIIVLIIPKDISLSSSIMDKLTFSSNSGSAQSRLDRWSFALQLVKEKPILGYGPGITAILNGTGSTSLYIDILIEFGIVGLSMLAVFMMYFLRLILKIQGVIKYVYLFSFIVAATHYLVISAYWFPWLWVIFSIVQVTASRQKVRMPEDIRSESALALKLS